MRSVLRLFWMAFGTAAIVVALIDLGYGGVVVATCTEGDEGSCLGVIILGGVIVLAGEGLTLVWTLIALIIQRHMATAGILAGVATGMVVGFSGCFAIGAFNVQMLDLGEGVEVGLRVTYRWRKACSGGVLTRPIQHRP